MGDTAGRSVFFGSNRDPCLIYEEIPIPSISDGQLLAKIRLATICGSDVHTVSGKRQESTPSVLGHEAIAEVVCSKRRDVNVQTGDRISFSIINSCGKCNYCCEYNIPQKCQSLTKYGHLPLHYGTGFTGCYATHIVLDSGTAIVKVPNDVCDKIAASLNCALSTMVCATNHLRAHGNVSKVLIQGAGMLGLLGCALLTEMGIKAYCIDVDTNRLQLVAEFGGTPVRSLMGCVNQDISLTSVDAVIEVCGVKSVIRTGMDLLRPGGIYILAGLVHPDSQLDITGEQLIRKCITLRGVHNYAPCDLEQAIDFLSSTAHKFPYEKLTGPEFPLKDLPKAMKLAAEQAFMRVCVRP